MLNCLLHYSLPHPTPPKQLYPVSYMFKRILIVLADVVFKSYCFICILLITLHIVTEKLYLDKIIHVTYEVVPC